MGSSILQREGKCYRCGNVMLQGQTVEWDKVDGKNRFRHPMDCPPKSGTDPSPRSDPPPGPRSPTAWIHSEVTWNEAVGWQFRVEMVHEDRGQSPSTLLTAAMKGIAIAKAEAKP